MAVTRLDLARSNPQKTEKDKIMLDSPISIQEIEIAIYQLKKDKWVQIAHFKSTSLFTETLKDVAPVPLELLWDCNTLTRDIDRLFEPGIIRDVCKAWAEINFFCPNSSKDILDQCLWYNSNIKNGKDQMLCNKFWVKKKLNKLSQLVSGQGFKTVQQLQREFGTQINFLDLEGIKRAILKEWMQTIALGIKTKVKPKGVQIVKEISKCSSIVYSFLLSHKEICTKMCAKWEAMLKCEIDDDEWANAYKDISKLTLSTKLRFFHY